LYQSLLKQSCKKPNTLKMRLIVWKDFYS